ncbi:MAG TPA: hypothetical protein VJ558_01195 [Bacillales bacterium]|nr:hypothetical protein [Bacillales bacterium]
MAKKPTTKASKTPKKAIQVKISVKPVKNPMMGEKAMPMMPTAKKSTSKNTQKMMKQEAVIEKKTANKPKTAAEKKLEQKISKATSKPYKGKR